MSIGRRNFQIKPDDRSAATPPTGNQRQANAKFSIKLSFEINRFLLYSRYVFRELDNFGLMGVPEGCKITGEGDHG